MNVLIADDHPVLRRAFADIIRSLLSPAEPAFFRAADRTRLFDLLRREEVDLLLLDLCMPGMTGLPELVAIRNLAAAVPVVIISCIEDPGIVKQAINCGAAGYIPKTLSADDFSAALKSILEGGVYVPTGEARCAQKGGKAGDIDPLTPRQLAVLGKLATGKSNKEIARELAISDLTVKVHITTIFRKLGVGTRAQAIVAFQRELVAHQ